jgi:hypothetical protein
VKLSPRTACATSNDAATKKKSLTEQ